MQGLVWCMRTLSYTITWSFVKPSPSDPSKKTYLTRCMEAPECDCACCVTVRQLDVDFGKEMGVRGPECLIPGEIFHGYLAGIGRESLGITGCEWKVFGVRNWFTALHPPDTRWRVEVWWFGSIVHFFWYCRPTYTRLVQWPYFSVHIDSWGESGLPYGGSW